MLIHRLATFALVATVAAGCGSARKLQDAPSDANARGCDRCHGYPPPPGLLTEAKAHPQGTRVVESCHYCHPQTVDAGNALIPESQGGHHLNGKIDFVHGHLPSEQGVSYGDPTLHAPDALVGLARGAGAQDCYTCHGSDLQGGIGVNCVACHIAPHGNARFPAGVADFRTNCTFCHGQAKAAFDYAKDLNLAAPPVALWPHDAADEAIGAHQVHLAKGVACQTCHTVPPATFPGSLDHIDGSSEPVFSGPLVALAPASFDRTKTSCANYCHGATLDGGANRQPAWTAGPQACNSCHGSPPPTGGVKVGWHDFHVNTQKVDCGVCHQGYVKDVSANPTLHVNGAVDVVITNKDGQTQTLTPAGQADHVWPYDECKACHEAKGLPIPAAP